MAYTIESEFMAWCDYWEAWQEWASQRPSLKHPIKYLKWYFSEPKFDKWIKEKTE